MQCDSVIDVSALGRWSSMICLLVLGCLLRPAAADDRPKIIVTWLDDEEVSRLRKAVPEARIVAPAAQAQTLREVSDADALLGRVTPELVQAGKSLKWVQVYSAGVERYLFPALVDSNIVMTNAKIIQGPNVADQAMALLLALTRRVHIALRRQSSRDWSAMRKAIVEDKRHQPIELAGKTALVIGFGGIGKAIGQRAHGFGMTVEGVDRTLDEDVPDWVRKMYTPDQLPVALSRADVVFLAVPLTPETEGMIDAEAFEHMKDGVFLVNIARGKVIDTDALVQAVRSGRVAGAGVDVTDPEPLPADHPLWDLKQVVITPHVGGRSDGVWDRRMQLLVDNVRRFTEDKPLRNVVDKQRGY